MTLRRPWRAASGYQWNDIACTGASCTVDPVADTFCAEQKSTLTLADTSKLCAAVTSAPATYGKVTLITAKTE